MCHSYTKSKFPLTKKGSSFEGGSPTRRYSRLLSRRTCSAVTSNTKTNRFCVRNWCQRCGGLKLHFATRHFAFLWGLTVEEFPPEACYEVKLRTFKQEDTFSAPSPPLPTTLPPPAPPLLALPPPPPHLPTSHPTPPRNVKENEKNCANAEEPGMAFKRKGYLLHVASHFACMMSLQT